MAKLILKECETCNKTYSPKETGTTESLCASCNQKVKAEIRKLDILRKAISRNNEVSRNIERLSYIDKY